VLWAVLTAVVLLLVGFALRAKLRLLQTLYVPASVAGGLIGLVAVQIALATGPADTAPVAGAADAVASSLRGWPGALIAVVFAGLLLERPNRTLGRSLRGAALAAIMVWIIVLGQVLLGYIATAAIIGPMYDVTPAFGQLIEAGFAGGHGTATALGVIYGKLGFPEGLDLGLFMATVGLVYSVISGIVIVNIAVRRGWTRSGDAKIERISGVEDRHDPPPATFAPVRAEVIDPFAFQVLLLALAVLVGAGLQWLFVRGVLMLPDREKAEHLENVPLFLFTLIGGLLVRKTMAVLGVDDLIDGASIKRMVGIAMEFLIVAAIASLRIETITTYLVPLVILLVLGFVWTAVCLVLSRFILPRAYWFELGILNYGMSTGTTAQGMMLLRIIDRDLECGAAEDYALAAPLSAPFIGGGVITLSLPYMLRDGGLAIAITVIAIVLAALIVAGRMLNVRTARSESPG
jgi:ESS family glutamate:Na+ symporter